MFKVDFPGGPVDKNPPVDAGDMVWSCSGKIPHAMGQLRPCTTASEPEPGACAW